MEKKNVPEWSRMNKIAQIINEWDPLGFFPMAPSDEYNTEIQQIFEYIEQSKNIQINELANVINNIFIASFGNDVYKEDLNQCEEVARKILH